MSSIDVHTLTLVLTLMLLPTLILITILTPLLAILPISALTQNPILNSEPTQTKHRHHAHRSPSTAADTSHSHHADIENLRSVYQELLARISRIQVVNGDQLDGLGRIIDAVDADMYEVKVRVEDLETWAQAWGRGWEE